MSIRAASTSTSLRVSAGCACTRLSGTLISSRSSLDGGSSPWPTSNQERLTPKIPARAAKRLLRGDALPCSHFATVDAFTPHSFAISACVRPATTRASATREPTSLAESLMPRGCASRSPSRKPCSELVGCCSAIRTSKLGWTHDHTQRPTELATKSQFGRPSKRRRTTLLLARARQV